MSSYWTESSTIRAVRRIIPCSTKVHWCHQVNPYRFARSTRKTNWWLLECRRKQKSVRFVDGFHKMYIADRNSSERTYVVGWETDKNQNGPAQRLDKNWKNRAKKRNWKLEHSRQVRGIYSIDQSDAEYKDIMKNARRKLETPKAAALRCWSTWIHKTKNRISNEKDSWRAHCRERTEFRVALQLSA